MQEQYQRLLRALSDPVFHRGTWQLLDPRPAGTGESYRGFIAHQWSTSDARRLVVVNWSAHQAQCFLPLRLAGLACASWRLQDLLSAADYQRHGDDLLGEGLYLDMPPYGYHLFDVVR